MVTTPVQLTDLIVTVAQEHPDVLGRLAAAVQLSAQLTELGDHLIGHFVDEARRAGASWTDIGESIGVTKQAAQKRFVLKESPDLKPSFDRYTDRARRVVVLARHHARFSERIGTEHLLLGLMDESGGLAAKTIAKFEGAEGTTRLAVLNALDNTSRQRPDPQPFSAHCKKALELTTREALRLGHTFVGTEHILLGLLAEEDGTAAKVMSTTGITRAAAEVHITEEFTKAISARR
ncbi:Clp protease N-terminal domain-containing protein [Actinosynnema sp. NPDC047251]|uniref:Clp domain protein n=1 Tax=Saccharothrix espanaensis (strain ATCC 51144 / DSM 44229 / JCM 9112 / NBRC 15066 / NRRL 15764) TaxID=1179773 RepID=K0KBC1_SACES|nr:Clp protease N-terminal domain-containing protein [Saccharothrix espanaensis]CCH34089.1 Clp domain protein [Saccharothrix espanaensis DSM 44229]